MSSFPDDSDIKIHPRPYFNHSVEFKRKYPASDRADMLEKAGLNVFNFPASMVTGCDMLSDSGTTTMTNKQWAALFLGDEAYGSNRGYFLLGEKIRRVFGEKFFPKSLSGEPTTFLFHQARPCEDALFTQITTLSENLKIVSNGHFDTTTANIEANNMEAVNFFSDHLLDESATYPFKGNMNISALKTFLDKNKGRVPVIFTTITNNTGGGQPVSMENIQEVSQIAHHFDIPFLFDACRFAENAWFIKTHEKGYKNRKIKEIVLEMFSYVDGFTMSFKKDGLANIGGGLFFKSDGLFVEKYPKILSRLIDYQIVKEGHPTYGGISGRDIMSIVEGLGTVVKEEYLSYRINQVRSFGENMKKAGIPVVLPIGGHAVYLKVDEFFKDTNVKGEHFGGISLTALLLSLFGHRACELGYFAFGKYDKETKKEIHPDINYVRFALPRLRYEETDLDSVVEGVSALYKNKDKIPGVKVVYGKDLPLRHFKARFEFL